MRIVTVLLLLLLASCGYHSPVASDSWVGGDARIVYVQLFDNTTVEPYLENYMTDALIAELSRSRLIDLTENAGLADVRVVGEVTAFTDAASAYGNIDQITEYSATMTVAVRLLRHNSSEIVWQQKISRSEEYLATVSKKLQMEGQRLAAVRISQRLAEDLYASMLNSF